MMNETVLTSLKISWILNFMNLKTILDPKEGISVAREWLPEVIILDHKFPNSIMNGNQVCSSIRGTQHTHHIPIIIFTNHEDDDDVFNLLMKSLADVVISKGKPNRLLATIERYTMMPERVNELKLREIIVNQEPQNFKILNSDENKSTEHIWLDGKEINDVRPTAKNLLYILAKNQGSFIQSDILARKIDPNYTPSDINKLVYELRKKIEPKPDKPIFITTQPRIGYRLESGSG